MPVVRRFPRLGATVDRYSFDVELSHLLLHAGLSRRRRNFRLQALRICAEAARVGRRAIATRALLASGVR